MAYRGKGTSSRTVSKSPARKGGGISPRSASISSKSIPRTSTPRTPNPPTPNPGKTWTSGSAPFTRGRSLNTPTSAIPSNSPAAMAAMIARAAMNSTKQLQAPMTKPPVKALQAPMSKTPYTGPMQNTIYGTPVTAARPYGNGMPATSGGGSGFGGSGGSNGGGRPAPAIPPAVVPPAVNTPPVVAPPATPPPVSVPGGGNAGSFSSRGNVGPFGREQRRRRSRGPLNQLSMTPELLQRLAMARLSASR